jgi:hypothetical protein
MSLFEPPACWYISLATIVAVYQAIRGIVFQTQYAESQKKAQKESDPASFALGAQNTTQIWFLRAIADGLLCLVSTLAGFESLLLAYRILNRATSLEAISGGAATVFVFLALFGILGATGQLPHLLQQGKWPR